MPHQLHGEDVCLLADQGTDTGRLDKQSVL
jgi:hypothetical protein